MSLQKNACVPITFNVFLFRLKIYQHRVESWHRKKCQESREIYLWDLEVLDYAMGFIST